MSLRPTPLQLLAVVVALTAVSAGPASAEEGTCAPGAAVKRAAAAYADEGHRLRTLHASSKLEIHADREAVVSEFVELYRFPGRARLEYRSPHSTAVVATDGRSSWTITKDGPAPSSPGHFVVPRRIRDLGALLERAKRGTIECAVGAPAGQQRVLVTFGDGEMVQLDIDDDSGLIHRYEGQSPGTSGPADMLVVEFRSWERVDGIWVATELETAVNGKLMTRTKTTAIRVNVPVVDKLFEAPHGIVGPPTVDL